LDVLQLFWVAGWWRERIAKWEPDPRSSNGGKPNPASYFVRSGGIFAILCRCAMLRSCWRSAVSMSIVECIMLTREAEEYLNFEFSPSPRLHGRENSASPRWFGASLLRHVSCRRL